MSFLGFKTMEWINEDEASEIGIKNINHAFSFCLLNIMNSAKEAAKGEPIDAPLCPYKLQPDYQGNQISRGLVVVVVVCLLKR